MGAFDVSRKKFGKSGRIFHVFGGFGRRWGLSPLLRYQLDITWFSVDDFEIYLICRAMKRVVVISALFYLDTIIEQLL